MNNYILDIDGTLWDTTEVVAKAWNDAVRDSKVKGLEGLKITADDLKREFGKPMNVIADDLFGDIPSGDKADILEICCGYEHKYIEANESDLTYPKVRETIAELSKNNNLYIVSNCQKGYIELVMSKNNIERYIKDYECYGNTLLSKGENIKLLMERNNVSKAIYVGDTVGDFQAAKEAGNYFVYASYGFGKVDNPDKTITSFEELLEL